MRSNHLSYRPFRPSPAIARACLSPRFRRSSPRGPVNGETRKRNEDGVVPHFFGNSGEKPGPDIPRDFDRTVDRAFAFLAIGEGAIGALKKSSLERR